MLEVHGLSDRFGDTDALRDVSFEVPQGEMLGIIGMNGSGKSTLLKIIAGITAPSSGQAEVRGTIGSLIEVVNKFGSFFYGSILGMFIGIFKKQQQIVTWA